MCRSSRLCARRNVELSIKALFLEDSSSIDCGLNCTVFVSCFGQELLHYILMHMFLIKNPEFHLIYCNDAVIYRGHQNDLCREGAATCWVYEAGAERWL